MIYIYMIYIYIYITVNHTNTRANDNIDAAIKEKDQIIQTLKYDLQQQPQRQQQAAPRETQHQHPVVTRQTQQPQYSTVTSIGTVHQRDYLPNQQQKHYRAAPDQIEGKKEIISAFTEEMAFLNTGIKNLEKRFQTILNLL